MIEVIPLQWSEPSCPNKSCPYDHMTAHTPLGVYSIEWKGWKDNDGNGIYLSGEFVGEGWDLEAAKKCAASHFRRKILSCLVKEDRDD